MITFRTPLIQIPRPELADDVVRCFVACALALVDATDEEHDFAGLSTAPDRIDAYLDAAGPGISSANVLDHRFSGCGIMAEGGVHRRMLVDAQVLYEPYYPAALHDPKRASITRAIEYLRGMGAWHWAATQGDLEPRPDAGCNVVMGCRSAGEAYGGIEHECTALWWEDGDVLVSADGGQKDSAGRECCKLRRRRWELVGGHVRLIDVKTGSWRRVLGWGWPSLMRYRAGLVTVPEGWADRAFAA